MPGLTRWYDPYIAHFAQADTIAPGGVQGLDRYAAMFNNPIVYVDPSGHNPECGPDGVYCDNDSYNDYEYVTPTEDELDGLLQEFGVTLGGDTLKWTYLRKLALFQAVRTVGYRFTLEEKFKNQTVTQAFKSVYGYLNFIWGNGEGKESAAGDCVGTTSGGCTTNAHQINFWSMTGESGAELGDAYDFSRMVKNVVHELGHAFYNGTGRLTLGVNFSRLALRTNPHYENGDYVDWEQHSPRMNKMNADGTYPDPSSELFADTFLAWTYDAWSPLTTNAANVNAARNAMNNWP